MKRRELIALLGGTVLTAALAGFAQATDRVPRIGVLMPLAVDDLEAKVRLAAFLDGLQQLGLDRWPQRADRRSLAWG